MRTEDYTVRLTNFEGPLDLLLHLIREAEMEITEIPIATIADQYMRHLERVEEVDIDLAGEFLVMAATLMEIKSRLLAPRLAGVDAEATDGAPASGDRDAVDPRAELVQQLLEYKRSRDAADALEERRAGWERRFPSGAAALDRDAMAEAAAGYSDVELDDLELFDLVEAFSRIVEQVNFDALGAHRVMIEEDVPLEIHAEDILDQLRGCAAGGKGQDLLFRDIFRGRRRIEMVGLFLAMLELVRRRVVRVRQDQERGEIVLGLSGDGDGPADQGIERSASEALPAP